MLILNRRCQQSVIVRVGDVSIRVMVTKIDPQGNVKLGFDAPKDVVILREELIAPNTEERK